MLRPFLLVGVGGSGGKTLRAIKQSLELRLQQEGWHDGWPKAWQLLHVDSPVVQDGAEFPAPFLPTDQYLGLVASGTTYANIFGLLDQPGKIPSQNRKDVIRPLPSPEDVRVAIALGAGQYRAIGRTIVVSKMSEVRKAVANALGKMNGADARGQLETLGKLLGAKTTGGVNEPVAILISSIAGGSGAGQFIDVAEAMKAADNGAPWLQRIFAMLYAPDVFDHIDGKGGIAPNALGAMAEAMAGLWTREPQESSVALYKSQGVIPIQNATYNLGPQYIYIIGRQNSTVDFERQPEVYSAVAASLSTWMTDDGVQDHLVAYTVANFEAQAVSAAVLPDNTGLKVTGKQAPPFSSMGFGRVSLGRDRFFQYASERLARSCIDKMLFEHKSEDPDFKEKTQDEWISHKADLAFGTFFEESKLNELSEDHNDVIDAIRPVSERQTLTAEFKNLIAAKSQEGLDKSGGQSIDNWHEKIIAAYQGGIADILDRETNARQNLARQWVNSKPQEIINLVARYTSQRGLPVTVELLSRLEKKLEIIHLELIHERDNYLMYAADTSTYVGQKLQESSGQESLRTDHPAVLAAWEQASHGFAYRAEADLRELAANLIKDFRDNLISSLKQTLDSSFKVLTQNTSAPKEVDGRDNLYATWPTQDSKIVPKRFFPAQNERLLVAVEDYSDEYSTLIYETVDAEKKENAVNTVLTEVIMGSLLLDNINKDDTWALIEVEQPWIPTESKVRKDSALPNQAAKFDFATDLQIYIQRARNWMNREETRFFRYLNEDLASYLDDTKGDKSEISKRKTKFREEFQSAVAASEPLVKLNAGLLSQVHGKQLGERSTVVSSIPFAVGSDIYKSMKDILVSYKLWSDQNSDKWFNDGKKSYIDIFSTQAFPYQPIVMDSVMQPIVKTWVESCNQPETLESFWKWRRARTLKEAVPASPSIVDAMVRGWFVAKTLEYLDVDKSDSMRGPLLKIWSGPKNDWVEFPHPLLYPGSTPPHDYLGVVLESLSVAMAMCNAVGSLDPLKPYHRLIELGGSENEVCEDLAKWIQLGERDSKAPKQNSARAGSSDDSIEIRREKAAGYIDQEKAKFITEVVNIDEHGDPRTYPVTWEVRDDVIAALGNLIVGIEKIRTADLGI